MQGTIVVPFIATLKNWDIYIELRISTFNLDETSVFNIYLNILRLLLQESQTRTF